MKTKERKEKRKVKHEPWCAKVIATNTELPYSVRCDCQTPQKKAIEIRTNAIIENQQAMNFKPIFHV